jgi:hypothetical protein
MPPQARPPLPPHPGYSARRTRDGKGVTIPSQSRYAWYYEQLLRRVGNPLPVATPGWSLASLTPTYRVMHVRLVTVPNFDVGVTGCDPYILVDVTTSQREPTGEGRGRGQTECAVPPARRARLVAAVLRSRVYDYRHHCPGGRPRHFKVKDRVVDLDVSRHEVYVRGDVRVALFDYDVGKGDDHMGHVVFNTAFIESNYLAFEKVRGERGRGCGDATLPSPPAAGGRL